MSRVFQLDANLNELVKTYYSKNRSNEVFNKIIGKLVSLRSSANARLKKMSTSAEYDKYLSIIFHWNSFCSFHGLPAISEEFLPYKSASDRRIRKKITGKVCSTKMNKTATIIVTTFFKHPVYKKTLRKSKKFKIHDAENECNVGDIVIAQECRRLSKDKYFRLISIKKAENSSPYYSDFKQYLRKADQPVKGKQGEMPE